MDALILLIPLSLLLGGLALGAFLWTMRSGQYDDLDGAAHRILFDDDPTSPKPPTSPLPPTRPTSGPPDRETTP
ncbi:cbb3-type cytochrome oxidase assembly protein CcoS [Elioraea sp.]|uniref:cbb3-type cytochrome oxidase assembly protein CcoS n=1 Tax=Elioraea sp. TaxID=2185103 RepID=UPI0025C5918B|nr:cbb3-type cytochrome oxidase assembly protein CcoS [Elioraea sp.]